MKDSIVAASRNFQNELINHAEYREALVVSVDRMPIGNAYRGAFNESQGWAWIGNAPRADGEGR
jgi:hypothetical protein